MKQAIDILGLMDSLKSDYLYDRAYDQIFDTRIPYDETSTIDLMAWYYGNEEDFFKFLKMEDKQQSHEIDKAVAEYETTIEECLQQEKEQQI